MARSLESLDYKTKIETNQHQELFFVVFDFVNSTPMFAIKMKWKSADGLLKIKLRKLSPFDDDSTIDTIDIPLIGTWKYSLSTFLDLLQTKVKKVKVSSNCFDYKNCPSLNFLTLFLTSVKSNAQFKFKIKDENQGLVGPLNGVLSAALHSPDRLLEVNLNLGFCEVYQEELINVLETVLKKADRLEKFKITSKREISLAEAMNRIMEVGGNLPQTLKELDLSCRSFDNKFVFLKIFKLFTSLTSLKITTSQIDLDDDTILALERNEVLRTLHLSLRNRHVTGAITRDTFTERFPNVADLQLDFD